METRARAPRAFYEFILLFAWDMPEIGFIGTGVETRISKHGSGNLMDSLSTTK
jgi:hypothetical protein